MTSPVPGADVVRDAMLRHYEALRARDAVRLAATFAEDAVWLDPIATMPIEGREQIDRFCAELAERFRSYERTADSLYVTDDGAAARWVGVVATSDRRTVPIEGIDVFDVDVTGRIRTLWSYWDAAVLSEPAPPRARLT